MPEFVWRAVQPGGAITTGTSMGTDAQAVSRQLANQKLTPLSISPSVPLKGVGSAQPGGPDLTKRAWWSYGSKGGGPVLDSDVLSMTSELAIMVRAGLTLAASLRLLIEMSHKPSVRELLEGLLDEVKRGVTLSQAMQGRQQIFGDFYVNMVRAGEASGQLSAVLQRLVQHLERMRALRENIVSATIYPAILLGVSVLSLVVMLGFVVPQFESLFKGAGDLLPMPTRAVMQLGRLFTDYGLVILVAGLLVTAGMARWFQMGQGRRWWRTRILSLPWLGQVVKKYQLTLYARALGTLLGNGVPLLASMRIAEETISSPVLRDRLGPVSGKVKEGAKFADAMASAAVFEPLGLGLIRVGDETGRIGPMMSELADIMDREVETRIKRGLTMLEPLLILTLGLLIAAIIVSILLGILSINDLAI